MFEPSEPSEPEEETLTRIYQGAPRGALAVAGIATGIVFALWLAFYLFVFIPRGMLQ
jgi:hypothetical protein